MSKWQIVSITREAAKQVASLFEDPNVKAEIERILRLIADRELPVKDFTTETSEKIYVAHLEIDAPNWYRVKILKFWIRIAFRLLVVRNDKLIELEHGELPDSDERYLDIIWAGYKTDMTYREIRRIHKKMHPK